MSLVLPERKLRKHCGKIIFENLFVNILKLIERAMNAPNKIDKNKSLAIKY